MLNNADLAAYSHSGDIMCFLLHPKCPGILISDPLHGITPRIISRSIVTGVKGAPPHRMRDNVREANTAVAILTQIVDAWSVEETIVLDGSHNLGPHPPRWNSVSSR